MKHIKLLLVISFLFCMSEKLFAQKILDGTKFLYLSYTGGPRPMVSFEQINKISTTGDNIYKFGIHIIQEKGNKVYYIAGKDTVLYYDYSLKIGSLFHFNNPPIRVETMSVDSIKMIQYNDGKFYKHWYLKSDYQPNPLIWVEGLGKKNRGWYIYDATPIHSTKLKSICQIDTLIYWDTTFNGFEPSTVSPTCDYISLLKFNSANKINNLHYQIFPNPVKDQLSLKGFEGSFYEIYNLIGQPIANGILSENIDTKNLVEGIYLLVLISDKGIQSVKFIKNY